jgi:tRNA threonylcarbamoyladenosine biosynthesis protein TsaE
VTGSRIALQFHSPNPETTQSVARSLAAVLPEEGIAVVLTGPLGAGKTVFAKGVAAGLGIDPDAVTSPTFAICSEYGLPRGRRLAHLDCYRLASATELEGAGFLDLLEAGTVVLVEWGERFREVLPADRLEITITRPDRSATSRLLNAVASGAIATEVLARWEVLLNRNAEPGRIPARPEDLDG